jgi:hypothetical protein
MASNTIDNFWFCPGTVPNKGMNAVRVSVRKADGARDDMWVVSDDQLLLSKNDNTIDSKFGDCYDRNGAARNCYLTSTQGLWSRAFNYTGGEVKMYHNFLGGNVLAPGRAQNFDQNWVTTTPLVSVAPGEYQPDCVGAGYKP